MLAWVVLSPHTSPPLPFYLIQPRRATGARLGCLFNSDFASTSRSHHAAQTSNECSPELFYHLTLHHHLPSISYSPDELQVVVWAVFSTWNLPPPPHNLIMQPRRATSAHLGHFFHVLLSPFLTISCSPDELHALIWARFLPRPLPPLPSCSPDGQQVLIWARPLPIPPNQPRHLSLHFHCHLMQPRQATSACLGYLMTGDPSRVKHTPQCQEESNN